MATTEAELVEILRRRRQSIGDRTPRTPGEELAARIAHERALIASGHVVQRRSEFEAGTVWTANGSPSSFSRGVNVSRLGTDRLERWHATGVGLEGEEYEGEYGDNRDEFAPDPAEIDQRDLEPPKAQAAFMIKPPSPSGPTQPAHQESDKVPTPIPPLAVSECPREAFSPSGRTAPNSGAFPPSSHRSASSFPSPRKPTRGEEPDTEPSSPPREPLLSAAGDAARREALKVGGVAVRVEPADGGSCRICLSFVNVWDWLTGSQEEAKEEWRVVIPEAVSRSR